LELKPETRHYISRELERRDYDSKELDRGLFPEFQVSPNPERDRREQLSNINKIKDFLRKKSVAAGEADQIIARALGFSSADTLRRRLRRSK
jgi:hypothetical protein